MLQNWVLFLVSAAYVLLLFGIATFGDRRARRAPARKPWIYSLALGVYCTSWTFYGAVGRAAASGWDYLPIYLGPALMFVFGGGLIGRIILISKRHNITSIADFIGARYGRHPPLAMLVALIAVFGILPYIALQLKAVAFGFEVLTGPVAANSLLPDSALLIAILLAAFAILFGTREVVSSENHHGMVMAIAFESVIKLLAFLAVGLYAAYGLHDGMADAYRHAQTLPNVSQSLKTSGWYAGFVTQTLLAMTAIICLPRQFHVAVVENTALADLRAARWIFPSYLLLISIFVLPITAAGAARFAGGSVSADTYVLALPLAGGHSWLALAAYLGGFSAATSMVIVASIALSTMLCNEVVMPLLLRSQRLGLAQRQDLSGLLKGVRRTAIIILILLAYLYYRHFTGPGTLTSIGLLSFAAVLQFAPSLVGGVYWRRGNFNGALVGLVLGFLVWAYTLLLPTLLGSLGEAQTLLQVGPFGLAWLKPNALFGLSGLDPVTHSTLWSLGANLLGYIGFSLAATPGLHERLQTSRFLEDASLSLTQLREPGRSSATVGDLLELLARFFGAARARELFDDYASRNGRSSPALKDRVDPPLARHTEHLLASALGTSSARLVLATALRGRDMQLEDVIQLLDETSHAIQFNRELLRATLEHLSQGVSVVDRELRLVAWNQRYVTLFAYPPELIEVGRPIEDLFRYNARRGLLGAGAPEVQVQRRLMHLLRGNVYTHERQFPDGTVIEIRGNPMPGGGFVTSYSDVTAYTRAQTALRDANETLEFRVAERTGELAIAKADAERANAAKTRFLAAASHDLVQPLHAARLFLAATDRETLTATNATLLERIGDSLHAAEQLLSGLLDISKLDAGGLSVHRQTFAADALMQPLAREFEALAATRGLAFRYRGSGALLYSDPVLLRRVLQNFLGNAVRYTRQGGVLLGVRHVGTALRIEVWDTGPGIEPSQQQEIFEEFRRLHAQDAGGDRGLGLGLAISERIARLLDHPLTLRSQLARGSVFAITVPLGAAANLRILPAPSDTERSSDRRARILVLDNEPLALAALAALLQRWGHQVVTAASAEQAMSCCPTAPDLMLVDYHLDDGTSGIDAAAQFRATWNADVPCAVITADPSRAARDAAAAAGYSLLQKPVKPAALRALMQKLLS